MRRSAPTKVALLLLVVASCSDAGIEISENPILLGDRRFTLHIADNGQHLRFERDGATLLTLDANAFEVGVVSEILKDRSYDPWEIERRGEGDTDVVFKKPLALVANRTGANEATIALDYGEGVTASVIVGPASASRFSFTFAPDPAPRNASHVALARVRVRTNGDLREGFYGLGEQQDAVDNRGKLRAMQIEADGSIESANNEAHVPVPLVVGTRGWAMFVASNRVGTFDVARKDPSAIEATFAVAELVAGAGPEPLRFELFGADAPLDLYREYFAATTKPKLPPAWALGPLLWRDENKDQAEVEDDITKIRGLDLATNGIWLDRPYATAVNTFDFDPKKFFDPLGMIVRARAAGLRVALWHTPYLEPAAEPLVTEAKTKEYFPIEAGIPLNRWSLPIDFTNPEAKEFWLENVRRYTALGIEGFKLDYAEDIVPSLGNKRNVWRFRNGADDRTMHHGYSALYHEVYADAVVGDAFLLCRAAHWGEQGNGCIIWPGDMDATMTQHREEFVPRGSTEKVVGVGGLPATVIMGLSLSASGFPFFGADTGGYRHSPPDRETWMRWVEQTALSTVMQVGDSSSQPPWVFTPENGRDMAAVDVYRTYARLHLRLFPYEWSYAKDMLENGRPIQRPLGLAHPELGVHPSDEYLFGDELLVAPIVTRGQVEREVLLPHGTWISFFDGTPYTGDAQNRIKVSAKLEELPLFLRAGAIVPMLRPTIDTLAEATLAGVDSFANDPGRLWALMAPGPPRRFSVYDGASIARTSDGSIEVAPGKTFDRGFVLELIGTDRPHEIVIEQDGKERVHDDWSWSMLRRGTLTIVLPAAPARVRLR